MTIQFTKYPSNNRVPGVYTEIDPSKANTGQVNQRAILPGQVLPGSPLASQAGVAQICLGAAWTAVQAGAGSQLERMVSQYRQDDTFGELWILPLLDNPASAAAVGSVTFTGAVTAAGTLPLYIGSQRVQVLCPAGATPSQVAAALVAACGLIPTLRVTAAAAAGVVTFTAKNAGSAGNGIDLRTCYLGAAGGESIPAGLTVAVAAMAGGTANPDLSTPLMNLADEDFEYYAVPYSDAASLNEFDAFFNDTTGRWAWNRMLFGHGFGADVGTIGGLTTFGTGRDGQHVSTLGYDDSPLPPDEWSASLTAVCASSLRVDPALPVQYLPMSVPAPPIASRFVLGDRNTLLYDGVSTFKVGTAGQVILERVVTNYQQNAAGVPDDSYLDVETMSTLAYVCRDLRTYLTTLFARKKLVSDLTRVVGNNIVSPNTIKAAVISRYRYLETQGYVQNSDAFAAAVQVEAAGNGLVKVLWPGDLVGQLRQIAILVQFTKST